MPMDFPDMKSLINAASIHNFRKINKDETEIQYRNSLADHVTKIDFVESEEIRNGCGWNKFSDNQNAAMMGRSYFKNKDKRI